MWKWAQPSGEEDRAWDRVRGPKECSSEKDGAWIPELVGAGLEVALKSGKKESSARRYAPNLGLQRE